MEYLQRCRTYIEHCKSTMPKLDIVVEVGPTGYPTGYEKIQEVGWTYDEFDRVFISTSSHYLFQRYIEKDPLASIPKSRSSGWTSAPEEILKTFIAD